MRKTKAQKPRKPSPLARAIAEIQRLQELLNKQEAEYKGDVRRAEMNHDRQLERANSLQYDIEQVHAIIDSLPCDFPAPRTADRMRAAEASQQWWHNAQATAARDGVSLTPAARLAIYFSRRSLAPMGEPHPCAGEGKPELPF